MKAKVTIVYDDILKTDCDCLTVPVNCQGIMGAGLAKKVKEKYLGIEYVYRNLCNNQLIRIGRVSFAESKFFKPNNFLFFPTKLQWKNLSQYSYIRDGLLNMIWQLHNDNNLKTKIRSIAMPKLGCGLGGLDWRDLRHKVIYMLENSELENIEFKIHE